MSDFTFEEVNFSSVEKLKQKIKELENRLQSAQLVEEQNNEFISDLQDKLLKQSGMIEAYRDVIKIIAGKGENKQ